ncbi:recombinase family protein [Bradyrhizobium diazoefficiens]|uniref:recombinase family protein n=1 Tax=Bradyrhizobium diazoefficiens TaxID=1355477 RepID=UPI00272C7745|nr:recombinase family protein [Bradyrhizobium diazoefficiens]WLA67058.1 recombinase family protein [Bradyrhizobium diazoefficiens]
MNAGLRKAVRCAIYTRVSTEHGLDQEFNSLDAQHEAASAYIKSQAHAGWTQIRSRYDDGGYSGGSTDRPNLQKLLDDVRAHKIDVIVVYKVDRLTRSLADFAKLVELFDAHAVSFVSVTQQFNTTTSMGRLTLNVLLSFAQFEREVTSERIRDKIAASKRKGLWVGGPLPLGYEMKDGKVIVVEEEAERVRFIFKRYRELSGVNALVRDLRQRDIRTKTRPLATGATRGGIPFGRGTLLYLLRNRFYIGEVKYKGEILPGEQPPIMDRVTFDAVQQKLTDQWSTRSAIRNASDPLLAGLLFDDAGYRMVSTHATKASIRYRYYVSSPHLHGESKSATLGSVSRVPAANIEELVVKSLKEHRSTENGAFAPDVARASDRQTILEWVERIDVYRDRLLVRLKSDHPADLADASSRDGHHLSIPWQKPPSKRPRQILLPHGVSRNAVRPERAERRARLVAAIARGRRWLAEIVSGSITGVDQIASRERCSVRQVNMTISLAFLAPDLVKAAVEGRMPRGIGVERLREAPAEWRRQFEVLGLNPQ